MTRKIDRLDIDSRAYVESPAAFSCTLALRSAPAEDVTVTLSAAGGANITITSPTVLTFTTVNWATPQAVACDLNTTSNDRNWGIGLAFSSADPEWDGITVEPIGITWEARNYNPLANLKVTDEASLATHRQAIIDAIWPATNVLPSAAPDQVQPAGTYFTGTSYINTARAGWGGLHRRQELRFQIVSGGVTYNIHALHLVPRKIKDGRLVIYHLGHSTGLHDTNPATGQLYGYEAAVQALLSEYGVLVMWMPQRGPNTSSPGGKTHDQIIDEAPGSEGFKVFVEPTIRALTWALSTYPNQYKGEAVIMGLSGGGWASTLIPALDTRIRQSYAISGSVPIPLRRGIDGGLAGPPNEKSDREQHHAATFGTHPAPGSGFTNWETLYLLAATGSGRRHVQIGSQADDTILTGFIGHAWAGPIRQKAADLGGDYDHYVDLTSPGHHHTAWMTTDVILPGMASLTVQHYERVIDNLDADCAITAHLAGSPFTDASGQEKESFGPNLAILPLWAGSNPQSGTFTFANLPGGTFQAKVSWIIHANRGTNVSVEILDEADTVLETVEVNQEIRADTLDPYYDTYVQDVGTPRVVSQGGTLKVRIQNNAEEYVCVDGALLRATAIAVPTITGTLALVGGAAMAAAPHLIKRATLGLTGAGAMAASGLRRLATTLALSGGSNFAASATGTQAGTLTLAGGSNFAASATGTQAGTLTLAGSASMTASGLRTLRTTLALFGGSALAASGSIPGAQGLLVNDPELLSITPVYSLERTA